MIVLTSLPIRRVAVGLVGITALGLGACSGVVSTNSEIRETLSASTPDGESTSTKAGLTPTGDADTGMKTLRPEAPATLVVTEVRVGSHEGFDRVTFELEGEGDPGWFIDYTDRPAQQGSGRAVEYEGNTALNVNLDGMVYPFDLGVPDPHIGTVAGAGDVTGVISVGTFEGRSQFVIGLEQQSSYTVQILQDPQRVVLDFQQR